MDFRYTILHMRITYFQRHSLRGASVVDRNGGTSSTGFLYSVNNVSGVNLLGILGDEGRIPKAWWGGGV